jgi:DNA-binding CsgD family transcriptional regulator
VDRTWTERKSWLCCQIPRRTINTASVGRHSPEQGYGYGSVLAIVHSLCDSFGEDAQNSEERHMNTLTWGDQRKISSFARELYSFGSTTEISQLIVRRLDTLIGGNSVLVTLVDTRTGAPSVLADNIGPALHELYPLMLELGHEHPGIKYHHTHPSRKAVAIADLLPLHQWKKTAFYNEIGLKLGAEEQLGIRPSLPPPDYLGVVVNRTRRTFTQRDRSVLSILQLHISEAWRTAKMHALPPAVVMVEALQPLVGGSIVVLNASGTLQFCSDLAQKHLEAFFAAEKPFSGGLPLTVEKWVRREIASFESTELGVRPPQPLIIRRSERSLYIQLASTRDLTTRLLLLRAEDPAAEVAKLRSIGLGARATEVLYWLAKGKANQEIGIILGMAPETVKAHLKRIFVRLNVENRTSAASTISELMGRA